MAITYTKPKFGLTEITRDKIIDNPAFYTQWLGGLMISTGTV